MGHCLIERLLLSEEVKGSLKEEMIGMLHLLRHGRFFFLGNENYELCTFCTNNVVQNYILKRCKKCTKTRVPWTKLDFDECSHNHNLMVLIENSV
jgi:hypothetical protein